MDLLYLSEPRYHRRVQQEAHGTHPARDSRYATYDNDMKGSQMARRDLQALPKAHLHIHLEGAMRPSTLTELCERYGIEPPEDTRGKRFNNFGGFLDLYWAACRSICRRGEMARLGGFPPCLKELMVAAVYDVYHGSSSAWVRNFVNVAKAPQV